MENEDKISATWLNIARKRWSILLLLALFSLISCKKNINEGGKIFIIAHGLNTSHPVHRALEFFANQLHEKSSGKLWAKIYPAQQLGSERETLELLQLGAVAATKVSAAVLENFAPAFAVFSVPYLFHPQENLYEALQQPACQGVLQTLERSAMVGLCYFSAGFRHIYTRQGEIRTPQDLRGLKIRVQESASSVRLFQMLGASPTPIAWGELYTALQQNVVEGAENNPPSYFYARHYEVCPHYFLTYHLCLPDVVVFSKKIWDRLTEQERHIIRQAAEAAAVFQFHHWQEAERQMLTELQTRGVKVYAVDLESFRKQTENYAVQYLNPEAMPFYQAIVKQKKAYAENFNN